MHQWAEDTIRWHHPAPAQAEAQVYNVPLFARYQENENGSSTATLCVRANSEEAAGRLAVEMLEDGRIDWSDLDFENDCGEDRHPSFFGFDIDDEVTLASPNDTADYESSEEEQQQQAAPEAGNQDQEGKPYPFEYFRKLLNVCAGGLSCRDRSGAGGRSSSDFHETIVDSSRCA